MSNHNYRDTFKIGAIYEPDGKTLKASHQYRVGRTGRIENLNDKTPMFFRYSDGHGSLITSNVRYFQEDDYGVLVTTRNSVYRLDDYHEKQAENICDETRVMESINIF
ncbi:hypothetical protein [Clostridium estertheticum]|uniref:hypothetical protein n=1 Tax=Clostridium estertheticum TaxID=238834 RepID=UPI001C0B27C0|nr:hypothetical protein [Clostridium estertheticum]MBU3186527.1 hypothetical protein [Clostridium estertheticum]